MTLPQWVQDEIAKFQPPLTGKVEISLEMFMGGITSLTIGGFVRFKPDKKTGSGGALNFSGSQVVMDKK